ncbi:hypothetical protein E3N88_28498 [Mikania micrantha]|uniref:Uncharacterized protein n=1 Tax=Mikania micrantha TaxID=192012 RepID=A0A5N6N0T5_9ASTR|nr:hypothetical protein E3N88_28498 [Mikania micrantha]
MKNSAKRSDNGLKITILINTKLHRMSMNIRIQSHTSKNNVIAIDGTLAVKGSDGDVAANAVFRHQLSSVSSIQIMASAGLRGLIGVQTSWILAVHLNLKWEDFSTVGMLYTIGIQCIYWKLEFHRGAQKLVVPVSAVVAL